jgi:hypothetical protein
MPACRSLALVLCVVVGCTVDAPDKSIGELTAGPVATAPSSASGDDGGSGGNESEDGADDDGDGEGSAGDATGSGDDAASDSGDTGPAGEQPASGMYSHCVAVNECVGLSACVTTAADDGFCTRACENPALDCDPSPGGNAPPVCALIIGSPATTSGCALDCSLGQMCPGGMLCATVQGVQVCV